MPFEITYETILLLAIFISVIFIVYRIFKMALRAALVAIASFTFPWVVKLLNLNLNITADIETGVKFALLGISLFLIYEFANTIIKVLKALTRIIRAILKRRK